MTHIHDDYTEIEKNRAYSYSTTDGKYFFNSILNYSNSGATSLFTNVNDMSKWVMNFYTHTSGDQKDIDTLTKNLRLNNGVTLSYSSGIKSNTYKGWSQYSHSGTDAGYQSFLAIFPELRMGFFVFSNLREFDAPSKVYAMADLFIQDKQVKNEGGKHASRDSVAAVLKDPSAIRKFIGDYIGADGLPVSFDVQNNKLYYHLFDQTAFLIQDAKNTFSIGAAPEVKFTFSIKENDTIVEVRTPDQLYYLSKYMKGTPQASETLKTYTGTYYSLELDCKYSIVLKGNDLFLTNTKYNSKLTPLNSNHFTTNYWWMSHLNMLRDSKNNITGFEVNSNGIMHLRFNRIK
jgi:hypothetical protein